MFDPCASRAVFIYCLWCPLSRRIRYIGKTIYPERRARDHVSAALRGETSHNASRWIRRLKRSGLTPRMRVILTVQPGGDWPSIERALIARAIEKGWPLTNQCEGGNNPIFLSEEHAADARRKKSDSLKASWADPEVRRRRSDSIKAAWADPWRRAQIQDAQRAAAASPKRKEELRRASRKAVTPEREAARIAAVKAYWSDPENRRRQSDGTRERMLGGQAKMMAAKRNTQP